MLLWGSELRGVTTPVTFGGQHFYFLTVFSNETSGEEVTFKVWLESDNTIHPALEQVGFAKNVHLSGYEINISAIGDYPIELNSIPDTNTLMGYPFAEIELMGYLVSVDNDPVTWSASVGSNINGQIPGSALQAVPFGPNWTGTECLEITATETGTSQQFSASQNVCFTIEPDYGMPILVTPLMSISKQACPLQVVT